MTAGTVPAPDCTACIGLAVRTCACGFARVNRNFSIRTLLLETLLTSRSAPIVVEVVATRTEQLDGVVTRVDIKNKSVAVRIYANIAGFGGDIAYGSGYVWTTLVGVPFTKIDASNNSIVAHWYGRGGDAVDFGYGTVWLANYNDHLVWRIKPDTR